MTWLFVQPPPLVQRLSRYSLRPKHHPTFLFGRPCALFLLMAFKIIVSQEKFASMFGDAGLSGKAKEAFQARGYSTVSDFAFSISDSILDDFILVILRDDPAPSGGVLGNPDLSRSATLMHVEAGRIRRLHSECKALTTTSATSVAASPPSQLDWEGAPPPKLSQEAMSGMEKHLRTITRVRS